MMSQCFPGCKRNLRQMVELMFDKKGVDPQEYLDALTEYKNQQIDAEELAQRIMASIFQYILYRVRSDAVDSLVPLIPKYQRPVDVMTPGLVQLLEPVVSRVIHEGNSTDANLALARETEQVLNDYFQNQKQQLDSNWQGEEGSSNDGKSDSNDVESPGRDSEEQETPGAISETPADSSDGSDSDDSNERPPTGMEDSDSGQSGEPQSGNAGTGSGNTGETQDGLNPDRQQGISQDTQSVLDHLQYETQDGEIQESLDVASKISTAVGETVDEQNLYSTDVRSYGQATSVHNSMVRHLEPKDALEALQASTALDAQLQSLLQTFVLNRGGIGRAGKLDTNRLHKLAVGSDRIFKRRTEKRGIDTEVVLCIDMSGSMHSRGKALITSKAVYAVLKSLRKIQGCTSSAIGFSGCSIIDILRANEKLTTKVNIVPDDGTLCGEALMQAMARFSPRLESRKVVIMMTDGDTENRDYFKHAIESARMSGIEIVGIGIVDRSIKQYLKSDECCVIDNLGQMVPELFRILRTKFLGVV